MKHRRIYAKIDLDALEHNIDLINSTLPDGVLTMAVIKADAYGHGAVEFAKFLEGKCDFYGLAIIEEVVELRRAGIKTPLLLLGYTSPEMYETAILNDVSLTVFHYSDALLLSDAAVKCGKTAKVHIAVDTGMSRIGFAVTDEDADAAAKIAFLPNIEFEGLFSHFATADEADKSFTYQQKEQFDTFAEMIRERGCSPKIMHLCNSAGIMEIEGSHYGMVRAGIILYGLYPSNEVKTESFPLIPVMELITHISHVKEIPAGASISYGRTHVTAAPTKVATIPVGYADGYRRSLSNKGYVLVGSKKCPILGRVCMDQMMVDVTALDDVNVGDKVVLIGRDGGECIPVEEIAELAGSFNYEFVCGIARRVPRVYFRGGKCVKTVSYLEY